MANDEINFINFNKLKSFIEYSKNSDFRKEWLRIAIRCNKFVDGEQWDDHEVNQSMKDIGAKQFTLNFISSAVPDLLSIYLRLNMRIGFKPKDANHIAIAEVLRTWMFNVQTKSMFTSKNKKNLEYSLITGIGFLHTELDEDLNLNIEVLNPLDVFTDPMDTSYLCDEQEFIGYQKFISLQDFAILFPDAKDVLNINLKDLEFNTPSLYSNVNIAKTNLKDINDNQWFNGRRIKIITIYYKQVVDFYRTTISIEGQEVYFSSFDEDLVKLKSNGNKIEKLQGTKIFKGIIHDNILLRHEAIPNQVPNQKLFPIIPTIHSKNNNGIPIGYVYKLIEPQILKNIALAKMFHYSFVNTILTQSAMQNLTDLEDKFRLQSGKIGGVVAVADLDKTMLINHHQVVPSLANLVNLADKEKDYITGLEKEFLGGKGNSISARAKDKIEQLTLDAQRDTIDQIETFFQQLGRLCLDYLRGKGQGDNSSNKFSLTIPIDSIEGDKIDSNINESLVLADMAVNIEKFANFSSAFENSNQLLISMMGTPLEILSLSEDILIKQFGMSRKDAIDWHNNYIKIKQIERNGFYTNEEIQQQQLLMQQQQTPIQS